LKHLHTCENDRGIRDPATSHGPIFEAVHEVGTNRWLTIESFGFQSRPVVRGGFYLARHGSDPDAIAFEGVKFLRRAPSRPSSRLGAQERVEWQTMTAGPGPRAFALAVTTLAVSSAVPQPTLTIEDYVVMGR